jgi:hypothetical protein
MYIKKKDRVIIIYMNPHVEARNLLVNTIRLSIYRLQGICHIGVILSIVIIIYAWDSKTEG